MTTRQGEAEPAEVPKEAKQAGETDGRWSWVEPSVWTPRMLTALESGVKGGKWFSLIDKVYAPDNLTAAFARVAANDGAAGVDHQTVAQYERNLNANQEKLATQLKDGSYCPQAVLREWIDKPGTTEATPAGDPDGT